MIEFEYCRDFQALILKFDQTETYGKHFQIKRKNYLLIFRGLFQLQKLVRSLTDSKIINASIQHSKYYRVLHIHQMNRHIQSILSNKQVATL